MADFFDSSGVDKLSVGVITDVGDEDHLLDFESPVVKLVMSQDAAVFKFPAAH